MKVFISVGMSGREEIDVRNDIDRATCTLMTMYGPYVEIVHNYDTVGPEDAHQTWYLSRAIDKMGECDAVYFLKGYENHRGCLVEEFIAATYEIDIIYECKMDEV